MHLDLGSVVLALVAQDPSIVTQNATAPVGQEIFGRPVYADDMMTWKEFLSKTHRIGSACEADEPAKACGNSLVCRKGLCTYCQRSRECLPNQECVFSLDGKHTCAYRNRNLIKDVFTDPWEFLCSMLIFASSVLSAAAGVGGGGMFVPLLISLSGLRAADAIPLSQVMIALSSFVNLCLFVGQRHPLEDHAKIDYNCAVLLEPMLALGVTLGVLANRTAPQWLLAVLLSLTLGFAFWRTIKKARKQREAELRDPHPSERTLAIPLRERWSSHIDAVIHWTNGNYRAIILIVLVWLLVFSSNYCQQTILKTCSVEFLVFLVAVACALVVLTFAIRRWGMADMKPTTQIKWGGGHHGALLYPAIGFGAGSLGGLLGIGGGMIISPVLLELGMHAESVQATTAVFVFLSSTLASLQFALMDAYSPQHMIWYGAITISATIVGQYICDFYVRRNRRYSLITFSIAGVLSFSLILMCFIGVTEAVQDLYRGANMGFSWKSLCNGSEAGIFTVDIVPSPVLRSQRIPIWNGKTT